jgi:hypothetical protein
LAALGLVAFKAAPVSQSQSVLSLAVSYAANDKPVVYQQDCDSFLDSAEINPCILQNGDFSKTIVLIGDSVLAQWYTLFPRIFSVPEWRVVLFTKSACPMVDEDIFYPLIGKVYDVCTSWRNAVLAALPDYSPDVVVIGSSATYDYTSEQWIQGSRRILKKIDGLAKQVIVIPGTPVLSFNGPGCLGRLYGQKNYQSIANTGLDCSQPLDADKHKLTVSLLTEAAKPFPSVKLLDLNGLVCPDGVCRAKNQKGIIVYRDTSHITNTFVISVIPEVIEMLRGLTIEADTF